jgi:WD40 repeat protein
MLAKMDGSPVFCLSNPLTRKCATQAPPGWTPETGHDKFKRSARMNFSGFAKGKYKDGWVCNSGRCATGAKKHPATEMRYFCMDCGFNLCVACSGVEGHSMSVSSIDVAKNGDFACSAADDTTCILWDTRGLMPTPTKKDPFSVAAFYKSSDSGEPSVRESTFSYHTKPVNSVRIAPSQQHFVSSSAAEFISLVWEVDRVKPNRVPLYKLEGGVGAAFVDRQTVATVDKHVLRLYVVRLTFCHATPRHLRRAVLVLVLASLLRRWSY